MPLLNRNLFGNEYANKRLNYVFGKFSDHGFSRLAVIAITTAVMLNQQPR
jgi:hypothetical protein